MFTGMKSSKPSKKVVSGNARVGTQKSHLSANPHLRERHNARYARTLIWTIAIAIGAFFYWSAITPVYEIVSGQGTIKPRDLSTRVEHVEGGTVTDIAVREGEYIAPGGLILQLDDRLPRSELTKLDVQLAQVTEGIARLEAVRTMQPGALNLDLPQDMTSDSTLSEFEYRLSQVRTIRAQQDVAATQQLMLAAQVVSLEQEFIIQRAQLQRYSDLSASAAVSRNQREELERENLRLESRIAQLRGEERIQDAIITQLRFSEEELIAQIRRDATLRLEELLAEQSGLQETRSALIFQRDRARITSPVGGIVNALAIQNLGEVVRPGEVIAEIIPSNGLNFAEIEIPADRIGGVMIGSEASLKVLTYDFTRYGDIEATVEQISPSSFQLETGQTVFRVRLAFDPSQLDRLSAATRGRPVSPGMTVVADIKSDRRTVLSYLLKPMRAIADRAFSET